MKYIFLGIIKLYKLTLSKILPPCCRFYPTCSEYGMTAIRRFGAVKGGYLTLWRIFRCNPFCNGGIDPVPEKFCFRPEKLTVSRPIDKAVNCAACYVKRRAGKSVPQRHSKSLFSISTGAGDRKRSPYCAADFSSNDGNRTLPQSQLSRRHDVADQKRQAVIFRSNT